MILEFIWIEDYGVIKNQGFNFNPNVFYSFNKETEELNKEVKDEIPIDFFNIANDTITNISALVGANGTGKSTALEFISRFLSSSRPLGGFIITGKEIINKSDNVIRFSKTWVGKKPKILNRLNLINNYRRIEGLKKLDETKDTKNNPLGLRIFDNLITDTRLIYYSGETNLQHTNRVYQSLLSMSDEYENSLYTDISDIALMATDQSRYRSDKAIYSGENPVLAYRSGESQRFLDLMLSDYRNLIPFSLDSLNLGFSFNDIDNAFFESYDEIAFKAIMRLLQKVHKSQKFSQKAKALISEIEIEGIGGYFNSKLNKFEKDNPQEILKIYLYHHILLRHIREQIMETMGELTVNNKLNHFLSLISEIEKSFTTSISYIDQIKDYLRQTNFAIHFTGSLNLKAVDVFYNKMIELNLWEYKKFKVNLSELGIINEVIDALRSFDSASDLKYKISSIFDLDIRGLSTGEKQFLKIFSRFVSYNLNNKSKHLKEKQFIILIDEFDLGFHPLWQRKFLNMWIVFLESYINQLPNNKIRVQLILTSHSPFVVSDLPRPCINFLSKKEGEKNCRVDNLNEHHATFGANIHELYSDSFFLNGALMGDFAKGKIDKIFQTLIINEPLKESKSVNSIIQMIGEPIVKTKLAEMYAKKIGENIEFARLKAHQEYINRRLKEIENNDTN